LASRFSRLAHAGFDPLLDAVDHQVFRQSLARHTDGCNGSLVSQPLNAAAC
jgi:hypothetical protein